MIIRVLFFSIVLIFIIFILISRRKRKEENIKEDEKVPPIDTNSKFLTDLSTLQNNLVKSLSSLYFPNRSDKYPIEAWLFDYISNYAKIKRSKISRKLKINLSREHRKNIMNYLESNPISYVRPECYSDWLLISSRLHPSDYKNSHPTAYKLFCDIQEKSSSKVIKSSEPKFYNIMKKAWKNGKEFEVMEDYIAKPINYLDILNTIRKYEIRPGLSKYKSFTTCNGKAVVFGKLLPSKEEEEIVDVIRFRLKKKFLSSLPKLDSINYSESSLRRIPATNLIKVHEIPMSWDIPEFSRFFILFSFKDYPESLIGIDKEDTPSFNNIYKIEITKEGKLLNYNYLSIWKNKVNIIYSHISSETDYSIFIINKIGFSDKKDNILYFNIYEDKGDDYKITSSISGSINIEDYPKSLIALIYDKENGKLSWIGENSKIFYSGSVYKLVESLKYNVRPIIDRLYLYRPEDLFSMYEVCQSIFGDPDIRKPVMKNSEVIRIIKQLINKESQ